MAIVDPLSAQETSLLSFKSPAGPAAAMIYPNSYKVGMSSLGFQQIFRNMAEAGLSVQRGFYDEKVTDPRSFERNEPIFRFPLVAYSLTYEPDIFNLVRHLERSGIAPMWRDRDDRSPVVLVGGLGVSGNPAIAEAFADVICVGEAEDLISTIAESISLAANGRQKALEALAATPGLYVPPLGFAENRFEIPYHRIKSIDDHPCHSVILTRKDEFGGAFLVEASRGCGHRCKFCLVSHRVGHARFRSEDDICSLVDEYSERIIKIGLMGAAVSDHPALEGIAEHIVRSGLMFSTSSLRADRLSDEFLSLLRRGGNKTITLAPEAGDETLRRRLGKAIKSETILETASRSARAGFSNLKLYWLIGTPGEDIQQETDAIIKFSQEIESVFLGNGGRRLICSVSPWTPKAFTPFSNESMASVSALRRALRHIRRVLTFRGSIRVPPQSAWEAHIEARLSVDDRDSLTPKIIKIALEGANARSVFS